MRRYCGIDLGCESTAMCVINESGEIVREEVVKIEESALIRFFGGVGWCHCVVEASPMAEWLCNIAEECELSVVIIDPRQAKVVTRSKRKMDRIHAQKLAQLARAGWYNVVHRKSGKARELRSYMTHRIWKNGTPYRSVSTLRTAA